jgi:hypothetical protein
MKGFATKLVALLVLGGLFCYLVLPGIVEGQLANRLQAAYGTPTKPDVEVSSSFAPELLLGRIDQIQVSMDQISVQGIPLYNAQANLTGVNVTVASLLEGNPTIEAQGCSLSVEAPALSIEQSELCLSYLGLSGI